MDIIKKIILEVGAIPVAGGFMWLEELPTEEQSKELRRRIKKATRTQSDVCFGSSNCPCDDCRTSIIPPNINLGIAGEDY